MFNHFTRINLTQQYAQFMRSIMETNSTLKLNSLALTRPDQILQRLDLIKGINIAHMLNYTVHQKLDSTSLGMRSHA